VLRAPHSQSRPATHCSLITQDSTGNILDDEALIDTLEGAKATSEAIKGRLAEAEVTERLINASRAEYCSVSNRGSVIYFTIASLALVDSMYQYSLAYFKQLFSHCLDSTAPAPELPQRLAALLEHVTAFLYRTVCRGLFERHKAMFAFVICTAIQREEGSLVEAEWIYLLRGGPARASSPRDPGCPAFISAAAWAALAGLESNVAAFKGLLDGVTADPESWRAIAQSDTPWRVQPPPWSEAAREATDMQMLLLGKCWREHGLHAGVEVWLGSQEQSWACSPVLPPSQHTEKITHCRTTSGDTLATISWAASPRRSSTCTVTQRPARPSYSSSPPAWTQPPRCCASVRRKATR